MELSAHPERVFTAQGTVLFVDPITRELRHAVPETSPRNAGLQLDGERGTFMCVADGARQPVVCGRDRSWSISNAEASEAPTVIKLARMARGWTGLTANGLFLCAEADGRVTLSRKACESGEIFVLPDHAGSAAPNPADGEDGLNSKLVIAGVGDLRQSWAGVEDSIVTVMFDPNADGTDDACAKKFFKSMVVKCALGAEVGAGTLHVTRQPQCSSLRAPNADVLRRYASASAFDVTSMVEVPVTTYLHMFKSHKVPRPNVLTIDAQGFEYEVLIGFGPLLNSCLAIHLKGYLYPIYKSQKLFHHLTALIGAAGLVLRKISPVDHFEGDIVEVDAFYTVRKERVAGLNALDAWKLALVEWEWGLARPATPDDGDT
jgi:FkbM family methyltransferase